MSTELITIETLENVDVVTVYGGGLDKVLTAIEAQVKATPVDISTDKGRKAVASLANKIARSKTFLDDMGKKLGEDAKKTIDAINADRKKAREFLDDLKETARAPLTEYENKEKIRILEHENALVNMAALVAFTEETTPETIIGSAVLLDEAYERNWEEFKARADALYVEATEKVKTAYTASVDRESNAAVEAEAKAKRDAEAQEQRDEAIREQAAQAERDRIADAAHKEHLAKQKREQDVEHRKKINNEALAALAAMDCVLGEIPAKAIIIAIAEGKIPHVSISY